MAELAEAAAHGVARHRLRRPCRVERIAAEGQLRGEYRRVRASRAVRGTVGVARSGELVGALTIEDDVDGLLAMTTCYHHRPFAGASRPLEGAPRPATDLCHNRDFTMRFLRMKPGHGEVLIAEGDVEVAEEEELLIQEFRHQLDQGMWAAVPERTNVGRREARMIKAFEDIPRDADRVIFFPRAAGGV